MAAKRFMFVCIGILALAGAYAIGASNVQAQVGGSTVVAWVPCNGEGTVVLTANGDFLGRKGIPACDSSGPHFTDSNHTWTYMGNCFTGTVANQQNSLGGVKSLFR